MLHVLYMYNGEVNRSHNTILDGTTVQAGVLRAARFCKATAKLNRC